MYFFNVHIIGWFFCFALALLSLLNLRPPVKYLYKISFFDLKKIFASNVAGIIVLVILAFFFFRGRYLPFKKTPKLYKAAVSQLEASNISDKSAVRRALSLCAIGNIHRCLCNIDALISKNKDQAELLEIQATIKRGIEEQEANGFFLE